MTFDKNEYNKQYYANKTKEQNDLKKKQLEYGLSQEIKAIPIINHYFKDNILKTECKFSKFDYIGLNTNNIYELKSIMYSINKKFKNGSSCVIDQQKIKSYQFIDNLFIIFSFKEDNNTDYYFIKFNYDLFDTFNKRTIFLKRGYENKILDIPLNLLCKM